MNKNFTKKIVSLASAVAIMGAVAVPAMAAPAAATAVTGKTNVFYTNENIIPGPDGALWGVKIPTGVTFTNANTKMEDTTEDNITYGVGLVSLDPNRPDLRNIFKNLEVTGKVTSENSFKFKADGATEKVGAYTYKVGTMTSTANTAEMTLPNLTKDAPRQKGVFELTEKANKEGKYKDVLTFSFTATKADLLG